MGVWMWGRVAHELRSAAATPEGWSYRQLYASLRPRAPRAVLHNVAIQYVLLLRQHALESARNSGGPAEAEGLAMQQFEEVLFACHMLRLAARWVDENNNDAEAELVVGEREAILLAAVADLYEHGLCAVHR